MLLNNSRLRSFIRSNSFSLWLVAPRELTLLERHGHALEQALNELYRWSTSLKIQVAFTQTEEAGRYKKMVFRVTSPISTSELKRLQQVTESYLDLNFEPSLVPENTKIQFRYTLSPRGES